jgi:hypothetical protein
MLRLRVMRVVRRHILSESHSLRESFR